LINVDGKWFEKPKTFFSRAWNDEKIISKIIESLNNCIREKIILQSNGNWKIVGLTSEGLAIETILDQSGKIITAYPYLDPL
jgi:hypothetical protein